MKCYLHVDYDPLPKMAGSALEAVSMAESILLEEDEEPSSTWVVQWRRDDLYPDRFISYNSSQLAQALGDLGSVVLQNVSPDGTLLGKSIEIFTDELEKKNETEAVQALEDEDISCHGMERRMVRRHRAAI